MTTYRLLVTGSRDWTDWQTAGEAFAEYLVSLPAGSTLIVVHGDAPGLDEIADKWARSPTIAARYPEYTILPEPHPADWCHCREECDHPPRVRRDGTPYCPAAGGYRNQGMVDVGADYCLAFPLAESRGTWDCARRAKRADIPTRIVYSDSTSNPVTNSSFTASK